MRFFILIAFTILSYYQLTSQQLFEREKRDYSWLLGTSPVLDDEPFDAVKINFLNEEPSFEEMDIDMRFHLSNSSISDHESNLLLYTNGINLRNENHDTLATNLAPTEFSQDWINRGYPIIQGTLFLPLPDSDSIYYLFHGERGWSPDGSTSGWVQNLFVTIIDVSVDEYMEKVIERDKSIINDTLALGRIVAARHANGKDWWVVVPELNSNAYYSVLLTPEGIKNINNFEIGEPVEEGFAQSCFSPDGTMYARNDLKYIGDNIPHPITIYDFDRCSGEFTSATSFSFLDLGFLSGGLAFSENSRFLYVMAWMNIYQFDLWEEDILASKVKVLEFDTLPPGGASGTFGLSQLAPDGKIYVSTTGATEFLSVIHKPNLKGLACEAEIRAIELPVINDSSMPNHAYYGLGPLDGSPCDTLNIDNPAPQVAFDYVIADSTAFTVDFYDGSIFSPDQWYWDFGDGATSTERFPSHTYMDYGSYQVCLTVSNATGSNTVCQEVALGVTGTEDEVRDEEFKVWPNPASDVLHISAAQPFSSQCSLAIYNIAGHKVKEAVLPQGSSSLSLDIGGLAAGVYIVAAVSNAEGAIWRERVVVQR